MYSQIFLNKLIFIIIFILFIMSLYKQALTRTNSVSLLDNAAFQAKIQAQIQEILQEIQEIKKILQEEESWEIPSDDDEANKDLH